MNATPQAADTITANETPDGKSVFLLIHSENFTRLRACLSKAEAVKVAEELLRAAGVKFKITLNV